MYSGRRPGRLRFVSDVGKADRDGSGGALFVSRSQNNSSDPNFRDKGRPPFLKFPFAADGYATSVVYG